MTVTVIVGAQWGDEGKGKVIDYLSEDAALVARFNGGNNAGHTVVVGDQTFKLHFLPSGLVRGIDSLLGPGMVLDPAALLDEIAEAKKLGLDTSKILISDRAQVIEPKHKEEDAKDSKIGTTKKGIGPAYADKTRRVGKRVSDILEEYPDLKQYVIDASLKVNETIDSGKNVLLEGAQGTLLDITHGTYPFVTASNTISGGACTGLGLGPTKIDRVVGIAKAYTTRVGNGPFPTELTDSTGDKIREVGAEFGTTTGRPRRCGWFDALVVRYATRVNGLTDIAVTKLDVLSGLETLKIATSYKRGDETFTELPYNLDGCEPQYEELPGWTEDLTAVRSFNDLPANAQSYVKRLEELSSVKISMLGVGPEREQLLIL